MNKTSLAGRCLLFVAPLLFASVLMADDAEIYYDQQAGTANPNILFLLDTSGSMNTELPDSGGKTRMQVMQQVLGEVLTNAPENLNVGLLRYGGHAENNANGVSFPAKPIDGEALPIIQASIDPGLDNLPNSAAVTPVRQFLADVGSSWSAQGYTPIVDSLYEAALYFRGEKVDFGNLDPAHVRAAHPSTYTNNACAGYYTAACNNSAGQCTGKNVSGCTKKWEKLCKKWEKQTQTLSNQCCGWAKKTVGGQCCEYVATGKDEAGNATGWACKDNNTTCSTQIDECTGGYTCTTETQQDVCTEEEQIEVEYCQHELCYADRQYVSPMQYECQSNYIVLMSDGRPEYSGGTNTFPQRKGNIESLASVACAASPSGYQSGACGPELTQFLASKDQSASLPGKQTVETFTVAFALDDAAGTSYLQSLATVGGGGLAANSEQELKQAFASILNRAADTGAPAMTVAAASPAAYGANQPHLLGLAENLALAEADADPLLVAWGVWTQLTKDRDFSREIFSLLRPDYLHNFAATTSNNGAFTASDVNTLTEAFTTILDKIDASASSFSSPAYTVDKNSLLAHDDEVFIPVFERSLLPLWSGNLKKFRLKDGQIMGKAADGTDKAALDKDGKFLADAWDHWGAAASGAYVKEGGAASLLDPASRTLYTNAVGAALSSLDKTNAAISKTLLGDAGMSDAYREQLLDFARGYQADGTARKHMGDVMNSRPLVMDYGTGKSVVLVGSNEGFLHVFDTQTGKEEWAFMPATLLKNIQTFYQNSVPKQHVYGVDGRLTLKIDDVNHDGKIKQADGDKAQVYFGMRRGSRAYYGLDITDLGAPTILWQIDNNSAGFAELGESWSKPSLAKMRIHDALTNTTELKDVLVFGAGFDPAKEEENTATRVADSMGRDVFIIEAETGKLLWSLRTHVAGAAAQLQHSIPADIRVLDMDRNGALDRLYFADTGGNLWRVDMDMDVRDADAGFYEYADAQLTHLADFGGSGTDKRKFYYEPDVALMQDNGKTVMTLAIGSGYRSHPQSGAINDRFYVVLDGHVYEPPPATFTTLQDLDMTALDVLEAANGTLLDGSHKGWLFDLPNTGEKVLAPAVTLLNKVVFTTFATDADPTPDPCAPPANKARAYVLDLFTGKAVANLDRSADGSKDKAVVAGLNEILDAAQVIFQHPSAADGTACTQADCRQGVEIRVGKMNIPLMDADNSNNTGENMAEKTDLTNLLPRMFWNDRNVSK